MDKNYSRILIEDKKSKLRRLANILVKGEKTDDPFLHIIPKFNSPHVQRWQYHGKRAFDYASGQVKSLSNREKIEIDDNLSISYKKSGFIRYKIGEKNFGKKKITRLDNLVIPYKFLEIGLPPPESLPEFKKKINKKLDWIIPLENHTYMIEFYLHNGDESLLKHASQGLLDRRAENLRRPLELRCGTSEKFILYIVYYKQKFQCSTPFIIIPDSIIKPLKSE